MKKIFLLIAAFVSIQCFGQFNKPLGWGSPNATITIEGLTKPKNIILPVTDTTLSGSEFEGAIVFKTSDKQPYIYNGTYWESIRRPVQAMWPLYFENDTLKTAIDNSLNRLISVGGYDVSGTNFTVTAPVKWTFDQVVYTRDIDATFNVPLTDPDLIRTDVVYIDSLGNFVRQAGIPDSFFATAPIIPYNAIPVTHINVNNSTIGQAPAPSNSFWSLTGNNGTNPSTFYLGASDTATSLRGFGTENISLRKDSSIFSKDVIFGPRPGADRDSRQLIFSGRGTNGDYQTGSIKLDANGSGQFGGAFDFSSNSGSYRFNPRGSTQQSLLSLGGSNGGQIWGIQGPLNIFNTSTTNGLILANQYNQTTGATFTLRAANSRGNLLNKILVNPRGKTVIGDSAVLGDTAAQLTIKGNIAIQDGTQGSGKVFTSDVNGKGSWQTLSSGPNYTFGNGITGYGNQIKLADSIGDTKISNITGSFLYTNYPVTPLGDKSFQVRIIKDENFNFQSNLSIQHDNQFLQLNSDSTSRFIGLANSSGIEIGSSYFGFPPVFSKINLTRDIRISPVQNFIIDIPSKGANKVLVSDENGAATWQEKYKVYTASITHNGTSAPNVTVLENTIGNIVWTRQNPGHYRATLAGTFLANKTWKITHPETINVVASFVRVDNDYMELYTAVDGTLEDTVSELSIEIRIYP